MTDSGAGSGHIEPAPFWVLMRRTNGVLLPAVLVDPNGGIVVPIFTTRSRAEGHLEHSDSVTSPEDKPDPKMLPKPMRLNVDVKPREFVRSIADMLALMEEIIEGVNPLEVAMTVRATINPRWEDGTRREDKTYDVLVDFLIEHGMEI